MRQESIFYHSKDGEEEKFTLSLCNTEIGPVLGIDVSTKTRGEYKGVESITLPMPESIQILEEALRLAKLYYNMEVIND